MKRNSAIILSLASLVLVLAAPVSFAGNYEQAVQSLTPSYYWHLDEAAGASVAQPTVSFHSGPPDSYAPTTLRYGGVANKHDSAGIVGRAVLLGTATPTDDLLDTQGVANNVSLAHFDPGASVGDGYTIEFWINPTSHLHFDSYAGTASGHGFSWKFDGGVGSYFGLENSTGTGTFRKSVATDGIANNQWSFVALTLTRTAATTMEMRYYVNGQLKTFDGGGTVGTFTDPSLTDFGVWNNLTFGAFGVGSMDEIAVFDHVLSQNDILTELYAVPEPGMLSLLALGGAFMVWRRKIAAKRA